MARPTRSLRFLYGVASGYGLMVVNLVYTMLSIPLALRYLGREEFGLWVLAQQLAGYLLLLDLGMSSALSRFLADHKDNVNGGEYGSLLLTGGLVFLVQGGLIAVLGALISFVAPLLFSIPPELASPFSHLFILLTLFYGVSVATRSIGAPLWAFQRLDLLNGVGAVGLLLSLGTLWLGFLLDWGLLSFAFAGIPALVFGVVTTAYCCSRCSYYPCKGHWGRLRWQQFGKIFGFGKDILVMSLGCHLVSASQVMLISRVLGLDAAATFSVATKFATMGQQFVAKIQESSAPGLTEMLVSGDRGRFIRRFWDMIAVTTTVATAAAAAIAIANRSVVSVWTGGTIPWTASGDMLLAILLIFTANSRCFVGAFGLVKDLRPIRHIYLLEGVVFILCSLVLVRFWQINGVLVSAILAHLSVTTLISVYAAKKLLGDVSLAVRLYIVPILICLTIGTLGASVLAERPTTLAVVMATTLSEIAVLVVSLAMIIPKELRRDGFERLLARIHKTPLKS